MRLVLIIATITISLVLFEGVAFAGANVRVYRWYSAADNDYLTIAEGEYTDQQLIARGLSDKTLLFIARDSPEDGLIAVYGWYQPVKKWHISVSDGEFSDEQLQKMGYTQKKLQYYVRKTK